MNDYQLSVNQQYGQDDLSSKILTALQNAGKNIDRLTREDLSTFDEFHNDPQPGSAADNGDTGCV